jgi:hypothetical protein
MRAEKDSGFWKTAVPQRQLLKSKALQKAMKQSHAPTSTVCHAEFLVGIYDQSQGTLTIHTGMGKMREIIGDPTAL